LAADGGTAPIFRRASYEGGTSCTLEQWYANVTRAADARGEAYLS
jgi:hypothetical protein